MQVQAHRRKPKQARLLAESQWPSMNGPSVFQSWLLPMAPTDVLKAGMSANAGEQQLKIHPQWEALLLNTKPMSVNIEQNGPLHAEPLRTERGQRGTTERELLCAWSMLESSTCHPYLPAPTHEDCKPPSGDLHKPDERSAGARTLAVRTP